MSKPLSQDLRERVIRFYYEDGEDYKQIAERLGISVRTVGTLVRQHRNEGHVRPKRHTGGRSRLKILAHHREALASWIEKEPDLTRAELAGRLWETFQVTVSEPHLSRILKDLRLTRKKKPTSTPNKTTPPWPQDAVSGTIS